VNKEEIKALRDKMGLSQTAFGALVYANYHTIGKWENGVARPRPVSVARLEQLKKELEANLEKVS
jgi:DNA-binding transcriptional regulator YiaG